MFKTHLFERKWAHKIGKLQEPSMFKCLVNTLYSKSTAQKTPRFLTKVNTYIIHLWKQTRTIYTYS